MLLANNLQSWTLDLPTLSLVAVCISGLLGLFLIIDWLQQRNIRALAWWGSAYLIGASSIALGSMPSSLIKLPPASARRVDLRRLRYDLERSTAVPGQARTAFRDLYRRRILVGARSNSRSAGRWQWLDRRRLDSSNLTRSSSLLNFGESDAERVIRVPRPSWCHACMRVSLVPLAMHAFLPAGHNAAWLTVFTLETILYAVGTAFIVMLIMSTSTAPLRATII